LSRENVDSLRPIYDEWARGNLRPVLQVAESGMKWGWSDEFPDLVDVSRDAEARKASFLDWINPWEDWQMTPEKFLDRGDVVVVLVRYRGRGKASGIEEESTGAHVWKLRERRPIRLEIYSDREKGLAAAGIADR
jgi:ketosteroid isomerase-like protein